MFHESFMEEEVFLRVFHDFQGCFQSVFLGSFKKTFKMFLKTFHVAWHSSQLPKQEEGLLKKYQFVSPKCVQIVKPPHKSNEFFSQFHPAHKFQK